MRIAVLLAALMILCGAGPTRAGDVAAAQDVIRAQEQAFARDDAGAAFSHAAPAIKEMFPTPDIFMAMVRNGYAPVYRHKSFEFAEGTSDGGSISQRVRIVDTNGEAWDALYTLELQPDGSYKITGCSLLKVGQDV